MSKKQINWIKWGTIAALAGVFIGMVTILPILGQITSRACDIWNMPPRLEEMSHDISATRQDVRDIKFALRIQDVLTEVSPTNSPYAQKHGNENNILK